MTKRLLTLFSIVFFSAAAQSVLLDDEADPTRGWRQPLTMVCDDEIYRYTSNEDLRVPWKLEIRQSNRWVSLCEKKQFFKEVRNREDYEASFMRSVGTAGGTECLFIRFVNNDEKTWNLSPTLWESLVERVDHKWEEIIYEFDFEFSRIKVTQHTSFYKRKEGSKTKVVRDHVDSKTLRIKQCRKNP